MEAVSKIIALIFLYKVIEKQKYAGIFDTVQHNYTDVWTCQLDVLQTDGIWVHLIHPNRDFGQKREE